MASGRVHFQRCWSCITGYCFDPPQWHPWADRDDIEHALENGHADPSQSRCGCDCAVEPGAADGRAEQAAAVIEAASELIR